MWPDRTARAAPVSGLAGAPRRSPAGDRARTASARTRARRRPWRASGWRCRRRSRRPPSGTPSSTPSSRSASSVIEAVVVAEADVEHQHVGVRARGRSDELVGALRLDDRHAGPLQRRPDESARARVVITDEEWRRVGVFSSSSRHRGAPRSGAFAGRTESSRGRPSAVSPVRRTGRGVPGTRYHVAAQWRSWNAWWRRSSATSPTLSGRSVDPALPRTSAATRTWAASTARLSERHLTRRWREAQAAGAGGAGADGGRDRRGDARLPAGAARGRRAP